MHVLNILPTTHHNEPSLRKFDALIMEPSHSGRFDPKTETKFDAWSDYVKILQPHVFGVAEPIYDTIETLQ